MYLVSREYPCEFSSGTGLDGGYPIEEEGGDDGGQKKETKCARRVRNVKMSA